MSVDPFVTAPRDAAPRRGMSLPPARPWRATRPGDLEVGQPEGGLFGYQGPDQGYALRLIRLFRDRMVLAEGERREDVEYGVIAVALRRASLFMRAPVKDDVEIALLVWGLLPDGIPSPVVARAAARRKALFTDVVHDPAKHRRIAEAVSDEVLRLTPAEVLARLQSGESLV